MKCFSKISAKFFCIFALVAVSIIPRAAQSGARNAYGLPYDPNAVFDSSKNYAYLSSVNNNSYRVYIDGDDIKFNYDN